MSSAIVYPAGALVALTAAVWVRLYIDRIGEMRERKIDPQSLATSSAAVQTLRQVQAADNLRNLFEVPVLFYALCALVVATDLDSPVLVLGAWGYVALRCVHSYIHITYNRVIHRFWVYAVSTVLLFTLWGVFLARNLQAAH
jgi:hypothetical protein